jgi:hypothetical protein
MNKRTIRIAAIAALTSLTTSLVSCVIDTPQTIAWTYYYCAKDTLEAGDPYAALDYLKGASPGRDSILDRKVDSLRLVIEKAIEEDKKTEKDSLTIKQ